LPDKAGAPPVSLIQVRSLRGLVPLYAHEPAGARFTSSHPVVHPDDRVVQRLTAWSIGTVPTTATSPRRRDAWAARCACPWCAGGVDDPAPHLVGRLLGRRRGNSFSSTGVNRRRRIARIVNNATFGPDAEFDGENVLVTGHAQIRRPGPPSAWTGLEGRSRSRIVIVALGLFLHAVPEEAADRRPCACSGPGCCACAST